MSYATLPNPSQAKSRLTILLIEDDDVDAMAVRRMFGKVAGSADIDVHRAHDGEEGIRELRTLTEAGVGQLVVLLDINMPRVNGHEFLRLMRAEPEIRATTVFVLTTSADPDDVKMAYDRHVAGYLTKSGSASTNGVIRQLLTCYADTVIFPQRPGAQWPGLDPKG